MASPCYMYDVSLGFVTYKNDMIMTRSCDMSSGLDRVNEALLDLSVASSSSVMPAFHTPFAIQKHRLDEQPDSHQNKRHRQSDESLHAAADASGIADDPNKAGEQYWNVQWYVHTQS